MRVCVEGQRWTFGIASKTKPTPNTASNAAPTSTEHNEKYHLADRSIRTSFGGLDFWITRKYTAIHKTDRLAHTNDSPAELSADKDISELSHGQEVIELPVHENLPVELPGCPVYFGLDGTESSLERAQRSYESLSTDPSSVVSTAFPQVSSTLWSIPSFNPSSVITGCTQKESSYTISPITFVFNPSKSTSEAVFPGVPPEPDHRGLALRDRYPDEWPFSPRDFDYHYTQPRLSQQPQRPPRSNLLYHACDYGSASFPESLILDGIGSSAFTTRQFVSDGPSTTFSSSQHSRVSSQPLSCEHCDSVFTGKYQKGNLSRHLRMRHKETVSSSASNICRYCGKVFVRADALRKHEWQKHALEDVKPSKRVRPKPEKKIYMPSMKATPLPPIAETSPESLFQPSPRVKLIPEWHSSPFEDSRFDDICNVLPITPDYTYGMQRTKTLSAPIHCGFCDEKFTGRLQRENRKLHIKFKHSKDVGQVKSSAVGWTKVHACGYCDAAYNRVDALRKHEMRQHPISITKYHMKTRELSKSRTREGHVLGNPDLPLVSRIQNVVDDASGSEVEDIESTECEGQDSADEEFESQDCEDEEIEGQDSEDEDLQSVQRGASISARSFVSSIFDTGTREVEAGIFWEFETLFSRESETIQDLIPVDMHDLTEATEVQVKRSMSMPTPGISSNRNIELVSDLIHRSVSTPYTLPVLDLGPDSSPNTVPLRSQASIYYTTKAKPMIWDPDAGIVCQRTNSWYLQRGVSVTVRNISCHTSSGDTNTPMRRITVIIRPPMNVNIPFRDLIRSASQETPSFLDSVGQLQQTHYDLCRNEQKQHHFREGRVSVSSRVPVLAAAYPPLKCQHCDRSFTGQNRRRNLAGHRRRVHGYGSRMKARRGSRRSKRCERGISGRGCRKSSSVNVSTQMLADSGPISRASSI